MNTFDTNSNLDFESGGLPRDDRAVDALLSRLGGVERSRVNAAVLDRIAQGSWNPEAIVDDRQGHSVARTFPMPDAETTGSMWLTPVRMAAAIALVGAVALGVLASRSLPTGNTVQPGAVAAAPTGTDTSDADLALIDALWADTSTDDLWADASDIRPGEEFSLEDLVGGGSSESVQGGAM